MIGTIPAGLPEWFLGERVPKKGRKKYALLPGRLWNDIIQVSSLDYIFRKRPAGEIYVKPFGVPTLGGFSFYKNEII